MKDAWGNSISVEEVLNAKMILTDSQLKMRKYYNSMQEYRECFKNLDYPSQSITVHINQNLKLKWHISRFKLSQETI